MKSKFVCVSNSKVSLPYPVRIEHHDGFKSFEIRELKIRGQVTFIEEIDMIVGLSLLMLLKFQKTKDIFVLYLN